MKKERKACGVRTGLKQKQINKKHVFYKQKKKAIRQQKKKHLRRTHWPKKTKLMNKNDVHLKNILSPKKKVPAAYALASTFLFIAILFLGNLILSENKKRLRRTHWRQTEENSKKSKNIENPIECLLEGAGLCSNSEWNEQKKSTTCESF